MRRDEEQKATSAEETPEAAVDHVKSRPGRHIGWRVVKVARRFLGSAADVG